MTTRRIYRVTRGETVRLEREKPTARKSATPESRSAPDSPRGVLFTEDETGRYIKRKSGLTFEFYDLGTRLNAESGEYAFLPFTETVLVNETLDHNGRLLRIDRIVTRFNRSPDLLLQGNPFGFTNALPHCARLPFAADYLGLGGVFRRAIDDAFINERFEARVEGGKNWGLPGKFTSGKRAPVLYFAAAMFRAFTAIVGERSDTANIGFSFIQSKEILRMPLVPEFGVGYVAPEKIAVLRLSRSARVRVFLVPEILALGYQPRPKGVGGIPEDTYVLNRQRGAGDLIAALNPQANDGLTKLLNQPPITGFGYTGRISSPDRPDGLITSYDLYGYPALEYPRFNEPFVPTGEEFKLTAVLVVDDEIYYLFDLRPT